MIVDQLTRASFYMALRFALAMAMLGLASPTLFRGLTRGAWLMGMGVGLPFAAGAHLAGAADGGGRPGRPPARRADRGRSGRAAGPAGGGGVRAAAAPAAAASTRRMCVARSAPVSVST